LAIISIIFLDTYYMDNMVKVGIGAVAGLALIGVVIMIKNRSSSTSNEAQESDTPPAPVEESQDLPGGMERESEDSEESLERESPSVGGRRKTKRKKRKSKRKKSKRL